MTEQLKIKLEDAVQEDKNKSELKEEGQERGKQDDVYQIDTSIKIDLLCVTSLYILNCIAPPCDHFLLIWISQISNELSHIFEIIIAYLKEVSLNNYKHTSRLMPYG